MLSALHPVRSSLSNGLTTLVLPLPAVHRAVITLYIKTGSRFETARESGISHFVEHMLFRGTPRFASAHELATAFEDWGGTLVASTSADSGNLAIAVPPENLTPVMELLAEVVQSPLLSGIELERGIIREEILEDLGEDGELVDGQSLVRRLAFGDHGLGHLITGPLDNIESFSETQIRAHFERTYVASGMVLGVAGPVDGPRVVSDLDRAFAGVRRGEAPTCAPAPEQTEGRFRMVRSSGSNQTSLHVAFRCPGERDPLEPAVDMLLRVIDDGMATRLYHQLCDTRGLCYDAGASYEAYEETGLVEFGTETAHERSAEVLEEILRITRDLAEHGPTQREVERAQKRCRWQHEAMLDNAVDLADFLALGELSNTAKTPAERLDQLLAVTRQDIHRAAEFVFRHDRQSVVAVGSAKAGQIAKLERCALG